MEHIGEKILAVSVGGTIAMEVRAQDNKETGTLLDSAPSLRQASDLLKRVNLSRFSRDYGIQLVSVPVANLDSNNIHPPLWSKVVTAIRDECVKERAQTGQNYKGVIITTGTDTKEFFAPAIAAAFGTSLNMPILYVSAQSIPDSQTGDARANLARSLAFIMDTDQVGSLLVSGDDILEAARSVKVSEESYRYMSSDSVRGSFVNGMIRINANTSIRRKNERPAFDPSDVLTEFADNVLAVRAIPGFQPSILIDVLGKINGLLVIPNGAGNLSDHEAYSYTPLLRAAQERDLPVLVASPFPFGSSDNSHYQAGRVVRETECITNNGMTMGAAVAMFYLGLKRAETMLASGKIISGQKRHFMQNWMTNRRFMLAAEPSIVYPTRDPRPQRPQRGRADRLDR